jgi:hypothetical protein
MFKLITMQSVAAIAIAGFLAGTTVLLTSVAPPANAMPQTSLINDLLAKADRLTPAKTVAACSERSWPNYDQRCLRRSAGDDRQVRVIHLKRVDCRHAAINTTLYLLRSRDRSP